MSDEQDRPKQDRPPIPEYDRFQMRNDFSAYGSPQKRADVLVSDTPAQSDRR